MGASSNCSSSSSVSKRSTRTTRRASGPSTMAPSVSPHILGGSKNLIAERLRREQAEHDLVQTRQTLKSITTDLVPHVHELTKAVKVIQLEQNNQVNIDAESQDEVENLNKRVQAIENRELHLEDMINERMETLLQQVTERFRIEKSEMQKFVASVQDAQDELTADFRLLHHEYTSMSQFLSNRMNVVDDTISTLRAELERSKVSFTSLHHQTQTKIKEVDEKLFELDKELLKVKLVLPSSVSAQLPPRFPNSMAIGDATAASAVVSSGGGLSVVQKLHELVCDVDSIKTDLVAYRQADRQQFDAITNRIREIGKSQQAMKKDVDARCLELQGSYEQMLTKVPSELSKRLLNAQGQWHEELQTLRTTVNRLDESISNKTGCWDSMSPENDVLYDTKALRRMDMEVHRHVELIEEMQNKLKGLETSCEDNETTTKTLASVVARLTKDLLGLYDWTNTKVVDVDEEMTFIKHTLHYFQEHARILPKKPTHND